MAEQLGNNPPFAIGQKVVALKTSTREACIKGRIYTVAYCAQCDRCDAWFVGIKELPSPCDTSACKCGSGVIYHSGDYFFCGRSVYFAPIQYEGNVIAEILEKFSPKESDSGSIDLPVKKEVEELV